MASACTQGSLAGSKGCEWCFRQLEPPGWLRNPPASAQQNHFHILTLEGGQPASPEPPGSPNSLHGCRLPATPCIYYVASGRFQYEMWGRLKLFFFFNSHKTQSGWIYGEFYVIFLSCFLRVIWLAEKRRRPGVILQQKSSHTVAQALSQFYFCLLSRPIGPLKV